jgi:hypothetical protein
VTNTIVKYRDWEFKVDRELTRQTYNSISTSGAESCVCNDCKNYVVYRDNVFPEEIKGLFNDLGIDYKKEVEITSYETLPNGLHHIGGWFHFKGKLVNGKNYRIPMPDNAGYTFDLTEIKDDFSIGFAPGNDLTYFEDKADLIQVEFMTFIPWVIDKSLETK